jgi:ABC-type uncharacterized transport system substrate-binding protein
VSREAKGVSKKTGAKTMSRKISVSLLATVLLATVPFAEAQEGKKIHWIGYPAGSGSAPNQAFVQGMRDLGYVEGKNMAFVYRTTEGRRERYSDLVAELVRLQVDVIVTDVTSAALALKKATTTIPIVMTSSTDPVTRVRLGVLSLSSSKSFPPDSPPMFVSPVTFPPGRARLTTSPVAIAILGTAGGGADEVFAKETEVSARAIGVQLVRVGAQNPEDIDGTFRAITKERANGLLMRLQPSLFSAHYKRVAEFTIKNRLPSIAIVPAWANAGGLMSYGDDLNFQYRRAATYVDKILKGTKPADLPVEAPTKFELVINLKTAKQIGLTIPPNVLVRADRVIR